MYIEKVMTYIYRFLFAYVYTNCYANFMPDIETAVKASLDKFSIAIVTVIGDRVVMLHPQILSEVSINTVASALIDLDLTEQEIETGLEKLYASCRFTLPTPAEETPE